MMSAPILPPLGRLNFPLHTQIDNLLHCRWCTARLIPVARPKAKKKGNVVWCCPDCDYPSEIIKEFMDE